MEYQYYSNDIYQSFFEKISIKDYDNIPANSTLDFLPMDTESLWLENQKTQTDSKTINYYLNNPIKYKLNNYGYRTNYDFKKGDEVNIFLGCSHTLGIGLHLENTWSHRVNEHVGGNFVNLAVGGSGIENQFRHLIRWANYFKIKNIFHYQVIYAREEFLYDDGYLNFQVARTPPEITNELKSDWFQYTLGSEHYVLRKYLTNIMAIENIANKLGSNYYFNHVVPSYSNSIGSRDFAHFSVEQHVDISNVFIDKIKNNDTSIPMPINF